MKKYLFLLTLLIIGMGVVLIGGCGSRSSSSYYYYPDWTPDGKIICVKKTITSTSGGSFVFPGNEETHYYITTMTEDGTQETDIKEISQLGKVAASPLGNYIAYTEGQYIRVVTNAGVVVSNIDCNAPVLSFDWSQDENKLVYNAYSSGITDEVVVVEKSGQSPIFISSEGSSVSWRYGDKIVYDGRSLSSPNKGMIAVNLNTNEIVIYGSVIGGNLSVSKINTGEVLYRAANEEGIKKFYLSSPEADPVLLINRNDIWNIHLSPNWQRIVGTGDGSGTDLGKGIYLINIDGTGYKQIK